RGGGRRTAGGRSSGKRRGPARGGTAGAAMGRAEEFRRSTGRGDGGPLESPDLPRRQPGGFRRGSPRHEKGSPESALGHGVRRRLRFHAESLRSDEPSGGHGRRDATITRHGAARFGSFPAP